MLGASTEYGVTLDKRAYSYGIGSMWTARDHALKRARAIAAMPDLGAARLFNDDVRAALILVGVAADDPRFAEFDRRSAESARRAEIMMRA